MAGGLTALAGLLAAALLARLLTPGLASFLSERGVVDTNYLQRPIPTCLGLGILAAAMPGYVAVAAGLPGMRLAAMGMVAGILLAALAGLVDDVAGGADPKGLRSHLAALAGGQCTAGTLKAAGLAGAGLIVAAATAADPIRFAATAALVGLSANVLNSLDLRPGRAGKAFLAGAALLVLCPGSAAAFILLAPLAGGLAGYLPWDLRGRVMLGDVGANLLGAGLGAAAALTLPLTGLGAALFLFAAIHAVVERSSLSAIIERSPVLRALDGLGRR